MKLDLLNKNHTKDTIKHMSHEIKRLLLLFLSRGPAASSELQIQFSVHYFIHSLYPLSGHHLIQKHPILGTRYKVFYLYVYSIPKII